MKFLKRLGLGNGIEEKAIGNTEIQATQVSIGSEAERLINGGTKEIIGRCTLNEFGVGLENIQKGIHLASQVIPLIEDGEMIKSSDYASDNLYISEYYYRMLKNNIVDLTKGKQASYYYFQHPEKQDTLVFIVYTNAQFDFILFAGQGTMISKDDFDITKFEINKSVYEMLPGKKKELFHFEKGKVELSDGVREQYLVEAVGFKNTLTNILPQIIKK